MTGTSEFATKRLLMCKYRVEDAGVLFEKFGTDPKMYEYSGWNPYATYDMAKATVQRFIDSYKEPDFYGWAIRYQGNLVGSVGAYDFDPEKSRIEVGMSIERDSWGKGFATEALTGVLKYLTEHEGIKVVTAWCASDNTGSMRAMQKAGMKQTATVENALEIAGKKYDKLIYEYSDPLASWS